MPPGIILDCLSKALMAFWSGSKRILMIFILTYKSDNSKAFPSLMKEGRLLYNYFFGKLKVHFIFFALLKNTLGHMVAKAGSKGVLLNSALKLKQVQSQDSRDAFFSATFKVRLPLGLLLLLM